jgi:branched-chain amino acid aminotransferase
MVSSRWSAGHGWDELSIVDYAPITIDPAMAGLHYGQIVFEGLKAYQFAGGDVGAFRPADHGRRFARSAMRLAMPPLPVETFVDAVDAFVRANRQQVPSGGELSLYLRPIMFASEANLALKPADEYRFLLLGFVAETFFDPALPAISVWASDQFSRTAPGGTGEAKCAGNYGAALLPQQEALKHGCQQVLWLDSSEHRWVEEMGGMNVFFVRGSEDDATLVTPPLTGTLLGGITRDSLLTMAAANGIKTAEEPVALDELRLRCDRGEISEGFACGTAAVVTPIGEIASPSGRWRVGSGSAGPLTTRLRSALLDIQYGRVPDEFGWMHPIVV